MGGAYRLEPADTTDTSTTSGPWVCACTDAERVFLKLRCEVGGLGQAEHVALQHVPAHLIIEGVTELHWNLWWR